MTSTSTTNLVKPENVDYFDWMLEDGMPFCTSSALRRMANLFSIWKKAVAKPEHINAHALIHDPPYNTAVLDQLLNITFKPKSLEGSPTVLKGKVMHEILELGHHNKSYRLLPEHTLSVQQYKILEYLGVNKIKPSDKDGCVKAYCLSYSNNLTRKATLVKVQEKIYKEVLTLLNRSDGNAVYTTFLYASKENKTVIKYKQDEISNMYNQARAVKSIIDKLGHPDRYDFTLKDAQLEKEFAAELDGLPVKIMCDLFVEHKDYVMNIDYKTTSKHSFVSDYARKKNYLQSLLYEDVLSKIFNKPVYTFLVEINWATDGIYLWRIDTDSFKNVTISEEADLKLFLDAEDFGITVRVEGSKTYKEKSSYETYLDVFKVLHAKERELRTQADKNA